MKHPSDMTPQERWARVGEILYKGICLMEMEKRSRRIHTTDQDGIKKEYTLDEAAKELSISRRTIHRWIRRGRLISIRKLNGNIFIPAEQLESLKVFTYAT